MSWSIDSAATCVVVFCSMGRPAFLIFFFFHALSKGRNASGFCLRPLASHLLASLVKLPPLPPPTRYPNTEAPVIRGMSFDVEPRTRVGIVGRTGAGKSSLTTALFRLVEPSPGSEVTIDGMDVLSMGLEDLRSRLAIVPQVSVRGWLEGGLALAGGGSEGGRRELRGCCRLMC